MCSNFQRAALEVLDAGKRHKGPSTSRHFGKTLTFLRRLTSLTDLSVRCCLWCCCLCLSCCPAAPGLATFPARKDPARSWLHRACLQYMWLACFSATHAQNAKLRQCCGEIKCMVSRHACTFCVQAEQLAAACAWVRHYAIVNATGLRRIASKHDKYCGNSSGSQFLQVFRSCLDQGSYQLRGCSGTCPEQVLMASCADCCAAGSCPGGSTEPGSVSCMAALHVHTGVTLMLPGRAQTAEARSCRRAGMRGT